MFNLTRHCFSITIETSYERLVTTVHGAAKHVIRISDPKIWNVCTGEKVCHLSSWCEYLHILKCEDTTFMARWGKKGDTGLGEHHSNRSSSAKLTVADEIPPRNHHVSTSPLPRRACRRSNRGRGRTPTTGSLFGDQRQS